MILDIPGPYTTLLEAIHDIDSPNREKCVDLLTDHFELFLDAQGSTMNHQAWFGGYYDHVLETMNVARLDYYVYVTATGREMPFSLSDALLILFLHDIEKPWKYAIRPQEWIYCLDTKLDREQFRLSLIHQYQIILTDQQENALKYAEGVRDVDYSGSRRTMNELAAFVHRCDLWSARIFHAHPLRENEPWEGVERSRAKRPL